MAKEEIPRSRGTVKWFHDHKGYGFITPDDGSEDLFVHQSSINSEGFRTLHEGQVVEFHIALEKERTKAIDVTGPGGSSVEKTRNNDGGKSGRVGGFGVNVGSGGRDRNGGDNAYGSGGGCYNCGESGHMARACLRQSSGGGVGGGGGDGSCYNCGDYGHMARDCNRCTPGGGDRGCYNCGDYGHMAKDCNRRGSVGFNGGGGACYNCGGKGHMARECPSDRGFRSGGGGGRFGSGNGSGGGRDCYNCGEQGHFARECPNVTAA